MASGIHPDLSEKAVITFLRLDRSTLPAFALANQHVKTLCPDRELVKYLGQENLTEHLLVSPL